MNIRREEWQMAANFLEQQGQAEAAMALMNRVRHLEDPEPETREEIIKQLREKWDWFQERGNSNLGVPLKMARRIIDLLTDGREAPTTLSGRLYDLADQVGGAINGKEPMLHGWHAEACQEAARALDKVLVCKDCGEIVDFVCNCPALYCKNCGMPEEGGHADNCPDSIMVETPVEPLRDMISRWRHRDAERMGVSFDKREAILKCANELERGLNAIARQSGR